MDTDQIKVIPKYQQLNYIDDVWEPLYNQGVVYIAKEKVLRSKNDIHLVFPKVNETSGYYGHWYLPRKDATSRKTFNNNGKLCYVVPFDKFTKFKRAERDERDYL